MLGQWAETVIAAPELLQSERGAKVLLASLAGDDDLHGVGIAFADRGRYLIAQKVTPTVA